MKTVRIHENLAFLRKKKGITQEELAKALNVSNQSVSKWEAGKCCPDISLLPDIAAFFEVSIDRLLVGDCLAEHSLPTPIPDTVLQQAIQIAQENKRVSTSLLQRKLKIGYNKAKELLDDMEQQGYVIKDTTGSAHFYLYHETATQKELEIAKLCTNAILNNDGQTLYQYIGPHLAQAMPISSYLAARNNTLASLGDFVAIEQISVDAQHPNKLYSKIRYSKLGLLITFVFHNSMIDGLWLGFYAPDER